MLRVEHRSSLSGGRDDWETPPELLERVRAFGPILLDPATGPHNPTRARRFYTIEDDGLTRPWRTVGLVYLNPPYSEMSAWSAKVVSERDNYGELVALTAARCGTRWYTRLQEHSPVWLEMQGRVRFVGARDSAPFPSALFYFGESPDRFVSHFADLGNPTTRWQA